MLEALSKVYRRHAARANLPLDGVAVGEGGFQAVEKLRHGTWPGGDGSSIGVWVLDGQAGRGQACAVAATV